MGRNRRPFAAAASSLALAALLTPAAIAASPRPAAAAQAEPTIGPMISGTMSVVGHTAVWTDYAYDDRGTNASVAATYPADAAPGNAADLIQLQLRPQSSNLVIRGVLETLTDAKVPSLGVGIDTDGNPATGVNGVPGGQWKSTGTPLGLERFVVIDGEGAHVYRANGTTWGAPTTVPATVDPATNTMTATIPNSLLGATGPRWRVVGVVGLARSGESWVDGSGPIYDLAYVHEPTRTNFQSTLQAAVLSGRADAAEAVATVDVAALRAGTTALAKIVKGQKNTLLYRSRLSLGEGISSVANRKYAGPYQPYVAWYPKKDLGARPPMIVFLHGSGQTHLDGPYGGDANLATLDSSGPHGGGNGDVGVGTGEISPDAVIVTPLGRSESALGYDGPSEQDILDVIADASRRFSIDQDRIVLSGYSLGGVGTWNLAQFYPDRWAGAVEIVGAPRLGPLTVEEEAGGNQTLPNQLENLRNLPMRMAHSRLDELELIVGDQPDQAALAMQRLGYDYRYYQFYRRDHLTFPVATVQCEMEAAIARHRLADPPEVVFSQEPAIVTHDAASGLDLRHDGAYWMSDMQLRGTHFAPGDKGTVDVVNLARPDRVPTVTPVAEATQNVAGGHDVCGPNRKINTADVWTTLGAAWSRGKDQPISNGISATLTKVASVTLDLSRMQGIDVRDAFHLDLASDGDSVVRLLGRWASAVRVERSGQEPFQLCPQNGSLGITTTAGTSTVWLSPTKGSCL